MFQWLLAISAGVFLLAMVGAAYYASPPRSLTEQQSSAGQKPSEEKQKEAPREGIIRFLFPDSISVFTFWLALCTILLAIVAVVQLGYIGRAETISEKSANAAKKAADIARDTLIASQRSWVSVKASISGPLIFDKNGATTTIAIEMSVIGNTPALRINPHVWMSVMRSGTPVPFQEHELKCQEARTERAFFGFTLFPGETFPAAVGGGSYSFGVKASSADIESALPLSADKKAVNLYVFGCVDYTFPTDPEGHHQTQFFYEVQRNGPPGLVNADAGRIPPEQLELRPSSVGLGRNAD